MRSTLDHCLNSVSQTADLQMKDIAQPVILATIFWRRFFPARKTVQAKSVLKRDPIL